MRNFWNWLGMTEARPITVLETYGENMYNDTRATIRQMKNGKFRLLSGPYGNEVVATYSRRRDAIRGAQRKGLSLT